SATDLAETYAVIGETRQLLEKVRESLKLDMPLETLISQVSVRPVAGQPMIASDASGGSPETAAAIANEVAAQLIAIAPAIGANEPADTFTPHDLQDNGHEIN